MWSNSKRLAVLLLSFLWACALSFLVSGALGPVVDSFTRTFLETFLYTTLLGGIILFPAVYPPLRRLWSRVAERA